MNIQDATKLATTRLLTMTRKEWEGSHQTQILPTNDSFLHCIVTSNDGKHLVRCWQPSADDLIAEDWEVVNSVEDQDLLKYF